MSKFWILLLVTFIHTTAAAQDDEPNEEAPQKELGPLDSNYMGTHPMVLVNAETKLFASNLAQYKLPHSLQLVYRVTTPTLAVAIMVKDADLVTIKPEPFNIQRLMRGESVTVKADVYLGHYERGGMMTHEQVEITFEEKLYVRELEDLAPSGIRQTYDSIDIGHDQRILIHQITQAPSYDQLILVYANHPCITQFSTSNPIPQQGETFMALNMCGPLKPLYYDAEALR